MLRTNPVTPSARRALAVAVAGTLLVAPIALAAPVVDGLLDLDYGPALSVQQNGTEFGDNTVGSQLAAGGSELNAGYAVVVGTNLHIFLSGNVETNFNQLEIFIDSRSGGQNQLRGDNPDVDFNGLNRMGRLDDNAPGLRFDAGFEADFYTRIAGGNTGSGFQWFSSAADIRTDGGGNGFYIGSTDVDGRLLTSRVNGDGGNPELGLNWGLDNSNTLGVAGGSGSTPNSDPATVNTGFEVVIPLSYLGDPTGDIRVTAFVNGSGHDFASNQFIGSLPPGTGNLAEIRNVDLDAQAGDQFITVSAANALQNAYTAASGNWSDAGNWSAGTSPNAASLTGRLNSGSNPIVSLDTDVTLNRLVADQSATLSGGTLTLDGINHDGIVVNGGSLKVESAVNARKNISVNVASGASVEFSGAFGVTDRLVEKTGDGAMSVAELRTGRLEVEGGSVKLGDASGNGSHFFYNYSVNDGASLDIQKGLLVINDDDGNPSIGQVVGDILAGRLLTTTAGLVVGADTSTNLGVSEFGGQSVDASASLVRGTLAGDANLDGAVDFTDLLALARNFGLTGTTWVSGDSNYDGTSDFTDLLAIARNFGAAVLRDGSVFIDPDVNASFDSQWQLAQVVVPEPATLGLIAAAGLLALRRR